MSKMPKRKFTDEQKIKAVEEYTSGKKTAAEVAREFNVAQGQVYQWKMQLEEKRVKGRVRSLELEGRSPSDARLIQRQEDEISELKRQLAEKTMIMELIKKLRQHPNCPSLKNVSGPDEMGQLLAIQRKLARS